MSKNKPRKHRPLNAQEYQLYAVLQNYTIKEENLDITVRQWREKKLKEFRERGAL
jgi:hypothetical protein